MTEIRITTDDGREENLTVSRVEHYTQEFDDGGPHAVGDEFWVVKGIDLYDTDVIPSSYVWLSGSLADPRDTPAGKFPLVYIPKDGQLTITEQDPDQ